MHACYKKENPNKTKHEFSQKKLWINVGIGREEGTWHANCHLCTKALSSSLSNTIVFLSLFSRTSKFVFHKQSLK
jgi:hypothetical protein